MMLPRRTTGTLAALALAALALAACNGTVRLGPPPEFASAAATRSCAPTDGPATSIVLSPSATDPLAPVPPYVMVTVWQAVGSLPGGTFDLTSAGGASHHTSASDYETITSGVMHVDSVRADSSVHGTVDLRFPALGRLSGTFHAAWHSNPALCG